MSKICLTEKEKKKSYLYFKYYFKVNFLKYIINNKNFNNYDRYKARLKLQSIPRNANSTRQRNRCFLTGRARGTFRRFGLCRNLIRNLAFKGEIPGIFKASW